MSDKEVRFGVANSVLWGATTTAASNGSVNSGHDAWTGGAAVVPLTLMGMGEVVFGGRRVRHVRDAAATSSSRSSSPG